MGGPKVMPTLHLRKYLHEIKLSGITLNLRKCNFALGEVKFVGHVIGSGQHRADPDKISVVQNMDAPVDKKQVRQILVSFRTSGSRPIYQISLTLLNHSPP